MWWLLWVIGGLVALVIVWWALKITLAMAVPPEVSGRALMKQELKSRGVDVPRIPDRAIDEIVQHCLSAARGIAMASSLSGSRGRAEDRNWRANLVRQIEAHAEIVGYVMDGGRASMSDSHIRQILVRNGVVSS